VLTAKERRERKKKIQDEVTGYSGWEKTGRKLKT
jgi:hypothetical protein